MYRLIVLSDLHYGSPHFFRQPGGDTDAYSLAGSIVESLGHARDDLDCLIFAGDFFSDQQDQDLGLAREGVRELIGALTPAHVVAVPGNHDLTWQEHFRDDRQYYFKRLIHDLDDLAIVAAIDGNPQVVEVAHEGEIPLALLLLDSCRLESEVMAGLGRIGDTQLAALEPTLNASGVSGASHRILSVLHHHLLPITTTPVPRDNDPHEGPFPRISLTVDAVEVLRRLSTLRVVFAIHGHQHHRAILEFRNETWQQHPPAIHVVACGSCGSSNIGRHFFLIEIDDAAMNLTSYAQHPDYEGLFRPEPELQPMTIELAQLPV